VIAVDTNILVFAHRSDSEWHGPASRAVAGLAEGRAAWAIPWPCVHEFLAIVTHPRIYRQPTPVERALDQVDAWIASPTLTLIGEGAGHWERLRKAIEKGRIDGPRVHDARVAALCLEAGVRELWSSDRDFGRFPELKIANPLVDS
jgi:hypothetical protein